jgi:HK97 family phage major capsid protein
MSDEIKTLIEEQNKAFNAFKEANDENLKKRDALLEDKLNKIEKDLDKFEDINQKLVLAEEQNKALQEQLDKVETVINRPDFGSGAVDNDAKEYKAAFERVMRRTPEQRDPEDMALIRKRMNALIKADDVSAGYLLAPAEMQKEIVKTVVEMTPLRSLAAVRTIGSGSLKQPKKTGGTTATRVGETATRSNTGDPTYGMIEIPAPEMYARIEVSLQMLEDSEYDLMGELQEDASEQFAYREGYEFINGLGAANQAEGILTNSDVGSVVSEHATLIKADGIMNLFYELKTAYVRNAVFGLNRSTLRDIRKLKDGNGQYLWMPGVAMGQPNTIMGAPYVEMPDMPDIGAGLYPVIYGDFRRGYVIVDRVAIQFQIDFTTGADDGEVIFRARKRVGGGVRLPEAIKKLEIAAS